MQYPRSRFTTLCYLVLAMGFSAPSIAGDRELLRRASWEARFSPQPGAGVEITSLASGTPLYESGMRVGDLVIAINGEPIKGAADWQDRYYSLRGDTQYALTYRRGQRVLQTELQFSPLPIEVYDDIDTVHTAILSDYNLLQRVILTRPTAARGRLPAIFVVGGLSCSSIEYTPGRTSKFIRSLQNMITTSNMLVMRVEKPGVGDSEGDCGQTDFTTELNGIENALRALLAREDVDPERVVVYGSSMGSAIAPYLVNKYQLNGLIADGTFYRSWFEHMLEIERRIKTMQGLSQAEISQQINQAYIPLYYGMLIEKRSYAEMIDRNGLLAEYNYHGPEHMYGRPMRYYHQVQEFDFAGHWSQVTVPVRIRWGTHDWIMSEADNDMILDVLKRAGNTNVALVKYPGLDHWDAIHPNPDSSFKGEPGEWDQAASDLLVEWARDLNARAWRKNQ